MNDHELNQPGNDYAADSDGADEATMPIGIGGMDDDESFGADGSFGEVEADGKRGLNSGAVLLTVVVLIAAAGLFSMRTLTRATAASDGPSEAEQSIESFLSVLQSSQSGDGTSSELKPGSEEAAVLDILNESYASRQVSLTNVQRNPFIIFEPSAKPDAPNRPQGPDPIEQKREDRLTLFQQAAGRLELRSVLMGNPPLATIGSNIVQVGGVVIAEPEGVAFRVRSISNEGVTMIAEDEELGVAHETTLQMDREGSRRGSPQRSNRRGPVRPR